jgi:hypothetical protein
MCTSRLVNSARASTFGLRIESQRKFYKADRGAKRKQLHFGSDVESGVITLCAVTCTDVFMCTLSDEAGARRVSGLLILPRNDLRLYGVVVQVGFKYAWFMYRAYPWSYWYLRY